MKLNINEQAIELACPKCGNKFSEKIGRLTDKPKITCVCGSTINIDASELAAGIAAVEKQLDDFSRSISGMLK